MSRAPGFHPSILPFFPSSILPGLRKGFAMAKLDLEESFTSWLAACDEMLATGLKPSSLDDVGLHPELHNRLRRGVACLERLQELWPARADDLQLQAELPADAPCPTRLGKFELRRELGRGGFGVVYLAHDSQLDREVALKIPRLDVLLDPELRNRFHHEALAAARLDHPLIVPVYEAGAVGIVSYIASAYCPGVTLAAWLKEQREAVPWRDAARLVADLADAVHHAHSRGVVHRDLKPGNILLHNVACPMTNDERMTNSQCRMTKAARPSPSSLGIRHSTFLRHSSVDLRHSFDIGHSSFVIPKITDFGLAKFAWQGGQSATVSGAIAGTVAYMAPEQAEGKTKEIGTATDVYGLAAILYELLTGRPPFSGATPLATLDQVRTAEPTPLRRLRHDLPADLQTICLKCLHKDPARRYASAAILADDLRRFLAGKPIQARPVGFAERTLLWIRRHPAWATVVLLVLGAVVATGAVLEHQRSEAVRQRQELRAALRELIAGADLLLARQSTFDVRPGLAPEGLLHLEQLYEQLEAAPENLRDADLQHELARAARLIGAIHNQRRDSAAAQKALARAALLLENLVAQFPEQRAYQVDLAVTLCLQTELVSDRGRQDALLGRAAEVVQQLADAHPDQPEFRRELARVGWLRARVHQTDDAGAFERLAVAALSVQEQLARRHPSQLAYVTDLSRGYRELEDHYRTLGNNEAAEQYAKKRAALMAGDW
jgi:serine/threonine protein kinase